MLPQPLVTEHQYDADGNPTGGATRATGLTIQWQDGPLGRGAARQEPNGCFVETVLAAAIDRLELYQRSKFRCDQNAIVIARLLEAMAHLEARTADREARAVEGTYEV